MPVIGLAADETPGPAAITSLERIARLSIPAGLIASHALAVKVVSHKGMESGGNDVIPVATLHPAEHVNAAVELCPAVRISDDDKYQNTVPFELAPPMVSVTGAAIVNIAVPMRIGQGVALLQPN